MAPVGAQGNASRLQIILCRMLQVAQEFEPLHDAGGGPISLSNSGTRGGLFLTYARFYNNSGTNFALNGSRPSFLYPFSIPCDTGMYDLNMLRLCRPLFRCCVTCGTEAGWLVSR